MRAHAEVGKTSERIKMNGAAAAQRRARKLGQGGGRLPGTDSDESGRTRALAGEISPLRRDAGWDERVDAKVGDDHWGVRGHGSGGLASDLEERVG